MPGREIAPVDCPRIKSKKSKAGIRRRRAACCNDLLLCQRESSGHVPIEDRGEGGCSPMCIQAALPCIRKLRLDHADQLQGWRDHIQEALGKDQCSASSRLLPEDVATPPFGYHQKRYYAPFMGYKFIAYLCP